MPERDLPAAPGFQIVSMDRRIVRDVRERYQLFLPQGYGSRAERWPLILFLHGGGERGNDIERVKVHGPLKIAAQRPDFPFIVVAPQVATDMVW
jgi:predicted peptidase